MMSNLGYSQTTFPVSVVINGDSAVCLTYQQVGNINGVFIENEYLRGIVDTLQQLRQLDSTLLLQHTLQLHQYRIIDSTYQQQIASWREMDELQKRLHQEMLKKQKRTYIKYGAIGATATFLIGVLIGR